MINSRIVAAVISVAIAASAAGDALEHSADRPGFRGVARQSDATIVRQAYSKLVALNAGSRSRLEAALGLPADTYALKFELSDFRTGPIAEILGVTATDLATEPHGNLIKFTTRESGSGDKVYVSYAADWHVGSYASMPDQYWTVADVFALAPERYFDVGRYVSYQVSVSYKGVSRTYRAVALFHDLFGSLDEPVVEFWDQIVGSGGTLTQAWAEQRAALQPSTSMAVAVDEQPKVSNKRRVQVDDSSFSMPWTLCNQNGHMVTTLGFPISESRRGKHCYGATFEKSCESTGPTSQECKVSVSGEWALDYPGIWDDYYHAGMSAGKDGSGPGEKGKLVSCTGYTGTTWKACLTSLVCSVNIEFGGVGGTMSANGDLWTHQHPESHSCHLAAEDEGSGDCDLVQNADQTLFSAGSELTTVSTECGNNSPIVIDVNGDGFQLTSALAGVPFDINGDGLADQLSWTAAGSDDGFLVLDTDGSGTIDNGRELFGNFTPQLPGGEANGFRALAVYDRPVSGGNADGVIDQRDSIFTSLRLWRDTNHNGRSEATELHRLTQVGVERLELDYKTSKKVDAYGNEFRYRAKVDGGGSSVARWAWDVFLVKQ